MSRSTASRSAAVSARHAQMLGSLLLGIATASAGCGPQDVGPAGEGLATVAQHSRTDADYAVVYTDSFSGNYQFLTPGYYTASQLTSVGAKSISSITVPAGWRVKLFSVENFTGSSLVVRRDTDLTGKDFDNWTASIIVESSVTLYRDDGFHGATQYVGIGEYTAAQLATVGNKALSSLRVAPGWKVTLYSGDNFTGSTRVITADKDLWANSDFNDQTSSLKVEGPVTLFQNDHFSPPSQNLQAGFYSGSQLSFGAYQLSALKVAPGWTVTLYSGQNFTGDTRVITADTDLWTLGDFNDATGSLKVEGPEF